MICEYDENKCFKKVSYTNNASKFVFTFTPPKLLMGGNEMLQFIFKNNDYLGLYCITNNYVTIRGKNTNLNEPIDLLDVLADYC